VTRLAAGLDGWGLNVRLRLSAANFDAACAPVPPGLQLRALLPGARAALIVGSGGPYFFERFLAAPEAGDGAANPLDRFTARIVAGLAEEALAPLGVAHAVHFPFLQIASAGRAPIIPFQRLGRAAGLGGPGPLGLQIHPDYGPWWAYRALIVIDRELAPLPPPGDGCADCPAPCVAACPAGAVRRAGFDVPSCHARRLSAEPCRLSCAARIACVRGPQHRYSDRQLAFHMAASLPRPPA
jgi:epoxyqueuosine reductase QueG